MPSYFSNDFQAASCIALYTEQWPQHLQLRQSLAAIILAPRGGQMLMDKLLASIKTVTKCITQKVMNGVAPSLRCSAALLPRRAPRRGADGAGAPCSVRQLLLSFLAHPFTDTEAAVACPKAVATYGVGVPGSSFCVPCERAFGVSILRRSTSVLAPGELLKMFLLSRFLASCRCMQDRQWTVPTTITTAKVITARPTKADFRCKARRSSRTREGPFCASTSLRTC